MEAIIELAFAQLDDEVVRARADVVRRNGEAYSRQIDAERAAEQAARAARTAALHNTRRRRQTLDALERELD